MKRIALIASILAACATNAPDPKPDAGGAACVEYHCHEHSTCTINGTTGSWDIWSTFTTDGSDQALAAWEAQWTSGCEDACTADGGTATCAIVACDSGPCTSDALAGGGGS